MYTNINIADGRAHKIDILLAVACLLYCHKIAEDIAMIKIWVYVIQLEIGSYSPNEFFFFTWSFYDQKHDL